jgi:hypothetical protein
MQVTRIDGVFADGSIVPQPFNRTSMHIGRLLTTGATVQGLSIALPPSGNQQLMQFVIRGVDGGAHLPWPQAAAPGTTADRAVELRSQPGDNGRDLTLEFRSGTWVGAGQPIVIVIDNSPDSPGLGSLYGCADGRITFPSRLWARNACEFEGVNCAAATGPGATCDAGPAADPIWGDRDGCATGHLLQSGAGPELVCMGDWPADQLPTSPDTLQLTVTGVTWLWDRGEPLHQPFPAPVNVDLWTTLIRGGTLGPLTVPAHDQGILLLGVRLHVASAEVSGPSLPGGPHAVIIGSGPEDSGQEIDLLLPSRQDIPAGQPLALAAATSQQPPWNAVWFCTPERWTIARLVQVVWAGL